MAGLSYAAAVAAGLGGAWIGIAGMLGSTWTVRSEHVVPLGGLELAMDPIAGLFLALIGISTAATSLYAIGTAGEPRDDPSHGRSPLSPGDCR